jgi:hypothetical protein
METEDGETRENTKKKMRQMAWKMGKPRELWGRATQL